MPKRKSTNTASPDQSFEVIAGLVDAFCHEHLTDVYADLCRKLPKELFTTLLESANVRNERIVSHGHVSPEGYFFNHDQHEWVVVLMATPRVEIRG